MKRPLIGLMPSHNGTQLSTTEEYLNSIWDAGGLPVMLAYTTDEDKLNEYVSTFDGFLFCGGVDIDPSFYGEEKSSDTVEICPERDAFEAAIFPKILNIEKPIMGICRGIQVLNVFMGGTLYQDISGHNQSPTPVYETPQKVNIVEGSFLHGIIGKTEIYTNSFHHQNIKKLSDSLKADGITDDGYIEAFHMPGRKFFCAVQWHPELYRNKDEDMRNLFLAFVNSCKD